MATKMDRENQLATEIETLKAALAGAHGELDSLRQKYQSLSDSYEKIRRLHFGTSSEKLPAANDDQLGLFNEAEVYADIRIEDDEALQDDASETSAKKPRQKPGRKPIPAHLERIEILHDVPEADEESGVRRKWIIRVVLVMHSN